MLEAGSHISHYEVIAPLGAGGMGEVYRARDTRIRRDVALKILPAELVGNPDRARRFEQEALAAGMLNHPNVLTVFDAGSHEGTPFIVSELLEGSRLRDHLKGHLPVKKAIDYSLQIASGLGAAHEKGIIHRDLKPENIFVLNDGRVKLLDFGLAKLLQPDVVDPDATAQQLLTSPGVVVGTAGYMSPEQVRGDTVDHRSDIFSLGVILYEMLSGSQPFRRDSSVETMNAILHDDPPQPADVPPGLGRILQHALEKNPSNRFQAVKDFAFAIEALSSSDVHPAVTAKGRATARRIEKLPAMPSYHRVTFRRGFMMSARFAPDGSVVYGAAWENNPLEIFASYQSSPEARPLGLREIDVLSVSPSGELAVSIGRRYIGGYATLGTLARLPLAGGAPRRVCEDVQEAQWTHDGKNFLIIRRVEGFYRIESPIGHVIYKTPRWISRARFSPKEDLIAFIEHPLWGDDAGSVVVIDRDGQPQMRSPETWSSTAGLAWTPKGDEVWFAGQKSGRGRDIIGANLAGKERVILPVPGRLTLHDISAEGKLLVAFENGCREAVAGRMGEEERNLSWFDWSFISGINRDGSFVVLEEQGASVQGQNAVYVRPTDGAPAVRIGEGRARVHPISPDEQWIAVAIGDPLHIELLPIGAGEPRVIPCDLAEVTGAQFLPDGKRLAILGNRPGVPKQIFELSIEGDRPTRTVTERALTGTSFAISHDGQTIAATTADLHVMLFSMGDGEERDAPGCKVGDMPIQWSEDNQAILVCERVQTTVKIVRVDLSTGQRHDWLTIHPADPAGILDINPVHITPDGQAYAYGYRRLLSDLYIVTGLL